MESGKLFLLDAYALIFRSYYAFIRNPMRNAEGFNTSTVYGFVSALEELIGKYSPTHFGVAFDLSQPTFRHELYPQYKANREATPEEIKASVPIIKDIVRAWGIPILEKGGYEADDIIGTMAVKGAEAGFDVFMVTPDKDYMQLVDEHISMLRPGKGGNPSEILTPKEVCEAFTLERPSQFIDILAIMGDASDNIPGAYGIGEKGATALIREFGSVENLLANTQSLKGKLKEKVESNRENIILSKTLATICCNVPIEFDQQALKVTSRDTSRLSEIYRKMGFRKFLLNLEQPLTSAVSASTSENYTLPYESEKAVSPVMEKIQPEEVPHKYLLVGDSGLDGLIERLSSTEEICLDAEYSQNTVPGVSLKAIAFSLEKGVSEVVILEGEQERLQKLKAVLENPSIRKVGAEIKKLCSALALNGITLEGELWDVTLAHYLLQPEERHNLNHISETVLKYSLSSESSAKDNIGQTLFVDEERMRETLGEKTVVISRLRPVLKQRLAREGLDRIASEIEMPLIRVLSDMEVTGVTICSENLSGFAKRVSEMCDTLEKEIFTLAGREFNIASPQQLARVLFEELKIDDSPRKTKTKQYSTGEEILQKLTDRHPIVSKILEFRGLKKLQNTYAEALPRLVNPISGRIHTSFNQAVTATGRLSSTDPNLQNIPIREEMGKEIRKAFISSDHDHILLSADYSQVELRLMAHISGDPHMREAFCNNADIHTATAARIYKLSMDEVTKEMRAKAKTANFGIIYGISAFGLSQRLNIPRFEAKALIDGYFEAFPGISGYMRDTIESARDKGYVETMFGRRRYLDQINSANANIRAMAERNAINAPIQGTAADIIKKAMIDIFNRMKAEGLKSKMILQVHDELVFDVLRSELERMKVLVKEGMEGVCKLSVPLSVEVGTGENWLEAH